MSSLHSGISFPIANTVKEGKDPEEIRIKVDGVSLSEQIAELDAGGVSAPGNLARARCSWISS